jgi:uncharacterized protein YciI
MTQAQPPSSDESSNQYIRYVYLLTVVRPELLSEELIRKHVAHLKQLEDSDQLKLCGPFSDKKGGMVILKNVTGKEAQSIAEADPFVSSGAETYQLRRWELSCRENNHMGMG